MTSLRERLTGFFRHRGRAQHQERLPRGPEGLKMEDKRQSFVPNTDFVHKFLSQPDEQEEEDEYARIYSGQTGCDLPEMEIDVDLVNESDVFAAFTGPDGGITSLHNASKDNECNSVLDELDDDELEPVEKDGPTSLPVMALKENSDAHVLRRGKRPPSRRRHGSVEEDYPELSLDAPFRPPPAPLDPSRVSADVGLAVAERLAQDNRDDKDAIVAGLRHWQRPNVDATGIATSLYECHPFTKARAASPIADTFAIAARTNAAVMAIADGVNWGPFSALASRCAVYGAVERVHEELFNHPLSSLTTKEVFQCLLRSFDSAQSLIMAQGAHFTTLTLCVVLPLKHRNNDSPIPHERYVACVCNVGDSFAYVMDAKTGSVREVTENCHDLDKHRDMTNVMGALGPFDGRDPDLKNLTCSMTLLRPQDVVFLLSDGISDNVDPVVGKFCAPQKERSDTNGDQAVGNGSPTNQHSDKRSGPNENGKGGADDNESNPNWPPTTSDLKCLPGVSGLQRHKLSLLRLEDVIKHHNMDENKTSSNNEGHKRSALDVCRLLIDFCSKLTSPKRQLLEDPKLYTAQSNYALPHSAAARMDQKLRRSIVRNKSIGVPGKLDHASVVAYVVKDRRALKAGKKGSPNSVAQVVDSPGRTLLDASRPRAPCASTEDLTFIESATEEDNEDEENTISSVSSLDN